MMGKIAVLCPGQGSQYVGMAKVLIENFPWTKAIYEEASDAIEENILKLCLEGPEEKLQLTKNGQPSILVTSYAWFEILRRNFDFSPIAGAGHSLGEYSALLSAGVFDLPKATRLVRKRGLLMQEAIPVGEGKMTALIGLSDNKVVELCKAASQGKHSIVVAANFNAPSQIVIAGHTDAVERAEALATGEANPDFKARKVIPLKVSAPFHSPLMTPVAQMFVSELETVEWKKPAFSIVNNADSQLRSKGDWVSLLRDQIDHPVHWTSCVTRLQQSNLENFVEMGPGKVLTGLSKRIARKANFYNIDSIDELKQFEKIYKEIE